MADSFIPDSFAPDTPAKAEKPEPLGPNRPARPTYTPHRTALDVILNPQGAIEHAVSIPASMALTGGAGALAGKVLPNLKYAPALARAAAEGVQRGVGSAIKGEGLSDILTKAGLGTVTAGATEGLMGLAGKVGTRLAGTARVREMQTMAAERSAEYLKRAKEMAGEAYEAVSARLMGGKIAVPSLSTAKLTVQDAVDKLKNLKSPRWEIALDEIAQGMNMLDKTQAAQKAGDVFKAALPAKLFDPRRAPAPLLPDTNLARTVADVITGEPIEGVPLGALATMPALSGKMPHLPIGTLLRGH